MPFSLMFAFFEMTNSLWETEVTINYPIPLFRPPDFTSQPIRLSIFIKPLKLPTQLLNIDEFP